MIRQNRSHIIDKKVENIKKCRKCSKSNSRKSIRNLEFKSLSNLIVIPTLCTQTIVYLATTQQYKYTSMTPITLLLTKSSSQFAYTWIIRNFNSSQSISKRFQHVAKKDNPSPNTRHDCMFVKKYKYQVLSLWFTNLSIIFKIKNQNLQSLIQNNQSVLLSSHVSRTFHVEKERNTNYQQGRKFIKRSNSDVMFRKVGV